jgi:tungstate transport system substrate-binding protein
MKFGNKGDFKIHVEGDSRLFNQYGVILVNPTKCPNVKTAAGQRFIDWLLSDRGQIAIGSYQVNGNQLFFPNAK